MFVKNSVEDLNSLPETTPNKAETITHDEPLKAVGITVEEDFSKYMDNIE